MIEYFASNKVDEFSHAYLGNIISSKEEYKNFTYWKIIYRNKENKLHREDGPAIEWSNNFNYIQSCIHFEFCITHYKAYLLKKNKCYFYNGVNICTSTDKDFKKFVKLQAFI
jgi:hypothetical protein